MFPHHYLRFLLFSFYLLIFLICAILEQDYALDDRKSELLAKLFISRNLSLKFEFIQKYETEANLFSIMNSNNNQSFRISTSTKTNTIIMEFMDYVIGRVKRLEIGCPSLKDYFNFHHLLVIINGNYFSIAVDCKELITVKGDLNDQMMYNLQAKKLVTTIGGKYSDENKIEIGEDQSPIIILREFTADVAIPLEHLCPKLKMRSEMGDMSTEIEHFFDNKEKQKVPEFTLRLSHLEERVNRLEKYQRGCPVSDNKGRTTFIASGSRTQNHSECNECQCDYDGNLHCKPIGCPLLNCKHPMKLVSGQCCPICGKRCLFNGRFYDSGEHFSPKPCTHCFCLDGRVECSFKFPSHCSKVNCPDQETPTGECCPKCVNIDHCNVTSCSPNAICKSGKYSATCQCKEGFFGDGHECYDIDECLSNYDANKQQSSVCGPGTICINLPGSFICKCLPGFSKILDGKTDNETKRCFDTILN